jgi:hypothetical protein
MADVNDTSHKFIVGVVDLIRKFLKTFETALCLPLIYEKT